MVSRETSRWRTNQRSGPRSRVPLTRRREAARCATRRRGVRHPGALRFHVKRHATETTQPTSRSRARRHPARPLAPTTTRASATPSGRGAARTGLGDHRRRRIAQTPSPVRRRGVPVRAVCRITESACRQRRSWAPTRGMPRRGHCGPPVGLARPPDSGCEPRRALPRLSPRNACATQEQ